MSIKQTNIIHHLISVYNNTNNSTFLEYLIFLKNKKIIYNNTKHSRKDNLSISIFLDKYLILNIIDIKDINNFYIRLGYHRDNTYKTTKLFKIKILKFEKDTIDNMINDLII